MWKLDCKESWTLKNWWFWTVVLEKTIESPLDCKKIQPVHPKGDQSWVFIGRTDVEVETPILWPPDAESWLIWKDPDAGKDWRWEMGMIEDEMVGSHHRLNGHGFGRTPGVGDGQGGLACCDSWGCKKADTTELLNWTELNNLDRGVAKGGRDVKREGTCVHLGLIQVDVRQKWNQYFKAVILPLKINKQKRILLRYVFLRKGMMVEFMTVEVAPGKWSRPDFQSSLYKASFLLLLFVVVFWSHFLNNLVYISANAGYFSVVCFSKARDPQLASFKGLDINTSKTHWQWVKTLIVYILCCKFFFFFFELIFGNKHLQCYPLF